MILKFTNKGKFVMQIGRRDRSDGNKDTKNVYSATDVYLYRKTNELFVADGYINRRVIVFDPETGAFKRMWGAFGNVPDDPPEILRDARTPPAPRGASPAPGGPPVASGTNPIGFVRQERPDRAAMATLPQFTGAVHAVKVSRDGMVYVADRTSGRVQVFTIDGKYLKQLLVENPAGIALSPDADQRFMYVVNMAGSKVVVVERGSLEVLYQFGARSDRPGDFQGVHHLAIDSKGNLYTAEAEPGNRFQRFVFTGLGSPPES
jgi:DNA-binding beta-propeller fold protein YncE